MHPLGLTQEEFRLIFRACEWVLIHESISADDLRRFLVARLSDGFPEVATRVAKFTDEQIGLLSREITEQQRIHRREEFRADNEAQRRQV